jgi:hypothetical protein
MSEPVGLHNLWHVQEMSPPSLLFLNWELTDISGVKAGLSFAGFEILTVVVMKNNIFWDTTSCSPLKITRRFRGTYRLHLQGRRISGARNQCESMWQEQQSASGNFGLYRKQGRKGRQKVSYRRIARRTDETATECPLHEAFMCVTGPIRTE